MTSNIREYVGRAIPSSLRSSEEATRWFLEALYSPCFGIAGAHVELRPIPTWNEKPEKDQKADPCRLWLPLRSMDDVALIAFEAHRIDHAIRHRKCSRSGAPGQLYYGVQPRTHGGGTHEDVLGFVALYADLDVYKKDIDTRAALSALKDLPVPPSAVIWSGGGLHPYWFLREMAPRIDRTRVEGLMRGIAHRLAAWGADRSILDGPRILRLPGTTHRKRQPAPVCLLAMDPNRRYRLWQVENEFPVPADPPSAVVMVPSGSKDFRPPALEWQGDWHHSVMHHLAKCRAFGASNAAVEAEAHKCTAEWGRHGTKSLKKALAMATWVNKHPAGEALRAAPRPPANYYIREGRG